MGVMQGWLTASRCSRGTRVAYLRVALRRTSGGSAVRNAPPRSFVQPVSVQPDVRLDHRLPPEWLTRQPGSLGHCLPEGWVAREPRELDRDGPCIPLYEPAVPPVYADVLHTAHARCEE